MTQQAYKDYKTLKEIWSGGHPAPVMKFFSMYQCEPKNAAMQAFRHWRRHDVSFSYG
jgi:hypothetical protein